MLISCSYTYRKRFIRQTLNKLRCLVAICSPKFSALNFFVIVQMRIFFSSTTFSLLFRASNPTDLKIICQALKRPHLLKTHGAYKSTPENVRRLPFSSPQRLIKARSNCFPFEKRTLEEFCSGSAIALCQGNGLEMMNYSSRELVVAENSLVAYFVMISWTKEKKIHLIHLPFSAVENFLEEANDVSFTKVKINKHL